MNFGHFPKKLLGFVEWNVLKGLLVDFDHEQLLRRQLAEVQVLDGVHLHHRRVPVDHCVWGSLWGSWEGVGKGINEKKEEEGEDD